MDLITKKSLPIFKENGTESNKKKQIEKKVITKMVVCVVISNLLFYLIFFPSKNSCALTAPKETIPQVQDGYVRLELPLISFIPEASMRSAKGGRIPITLYDDHQSLISTKAYLVSQSSGNKTNNEGFNEESSLGQRGFQVFTIDVPENDLENIVKKDTQIQYRAFPFQSNALANREMANLNRKKHSPEAQYEITF